jgi:hypothetical protein
MNKINWSVAILDVITIVVAVIGYMTSNNVLPNYAVILGLVSFTLTTIAVVVFGTQITTLKKTVLKLQGTLYTNNMNQPK